MYSLYCNSISRLLDVYLKFRAYLEICIRVVGLVSRRFINVRLCFRSGLID